jgi:hypothetical protein
LAGIGADAIDLAMTVGVTASLAVTAIGWGLAARGTREVTFAP